MKKGGTSCSRQSASPRAWSLKRASMAKAIRAGVGPGSTTGWAQPAMSQANSISPPPAAQRRAFLPAMTLPPVRSLYPPG